MTLTERLKDVRKRLDYMGEMKNLGPQDYQAILVSIIRDCQRDGAEAEREACAQICEEGIGTANIVKAEGIISIASVMKTLAEKIRARSS